MDLTADEEANLIQDIATRTGTAEEIAKWYATTVDELQAWVATHKAELLEYRDSGPERPLEPTPMELGDLWITNKFERLRRLEQIADATLEIIVAGGVDQALLREFRSYLALAANELGQLLHRGSGESAEGETLEVSITGVDMDTMK